MCPQWLLWWSTHCPAHPVQFSMCWLGHTDEGLAALRKSSATTAGSIQHAPHCKCYPILNFNGTDRAPGLLGHPWGKRVAPISTELEKGEWNSAQIILPPLLQKLCHWETGAQYKVEYPAWWHGHIHDKEDQDHTLKCSLWSSGKS